jgi:hypothetical protein
MTLENISAIHQKLSKIGVVGASSPTVDSAKVAKPSPVVSPEALSLNNVIKLIDEMADWQRSIRAISQDLTDSLKDISISFSDLYNTVIQNVDEISPFEKQSITEQDIQMMIAQNENNEDLQKAVEGLFGSQAPVFTKEAVDTIPVNEIVKIHETMNKTFLNVVAGFKEIPEEARYQMHPRIVETVAEILVSLDVFKKHKVKAESVELSIQRNLAELEKNTKFHRQTELLAETMRSLYYLAKPRITAEDLTAHLIDIKAHSTRTSHIAMEVYKKLINEAASFDQKVFSESVEEFKKLITWQPPISNPFEAKELVDRFSRSGSYPHLMKAYEDSGLEISMFMQSIMMVQQDPSLALPPPPSASVFKRSLPDKNVVVQMQNTLVKELENVKNIIKNACDAGALQGVSAEIVIGFCQAIASAGAQLEHGFGAEDLTLAGFKHGMELSSDTNFVQGSMRQQQLLAEIAELSQKEGNGGPSTCSVM